MTKEQIVQGYLMNSPKVVAEMLYETIERYENRSCESCRYFHQNYLCLDLGCGDIKPKEIGLKYCGNWESK